MFAGDRNVRIAVPVNVDLTGSTCVLSARDPVTAETTNFPMTIASVPLINIAGVTVAQAHFWAYYDTNGAEFGAPPDIGDWEASMVADWVAGSHYTSPIFIIPVAAPLKPL